MNIFRITLLILAITLSSSFAVARDEVGSTHSGQDNSHGSSSYSPDTGNKPDSTYVRGHKTKNGTYVKAHRRSNPDKNFNNNWSTKGNDNPYTGKEGSKLTPSTYN